MSNFPSQLSALHFIKFTLKDKRFCCKMALVMALPMRPAVIKWIVLALALSSTSGQVKKYWESPAPGLAIK